MILTFELIIIIISKAQILKKPSAVYKERYVWEGELVNVHIHVYDYMYKNQTNKAKLKHILRSHTLTHSLSLSLSLSRTHTHTHTVQWLAESVQNKSYAQDFFAAVAQY